MADDKPTVVERRGSGPDLPARDRPAEVESGVRYTSSHEIARGGMGRVVEATDTLLGRVVAVKEALATDAEAIRRFARETRITARLEHPSIVPVYDAGTTSDGSPYYVMRKVTGRPLDKLIADAETVNQRLRLLPNVLAAAQAIAHAHQRNVLHRDFKPANILVGDLGETVVIDWGLAKVLDEPDEPDEPEPHPEMTAGDSLRTRVGVVFGTPGFMSPEQVRGEAVDARSDVYAIGATLYYLLARRPPHAAPSGDEMMQRALAGPPTPIAKYVGGLPRELSTIIDKALAYDGAARYPDAGALAEELQQFLAGQLVESHAYSARERLVRIVRRHRIAVIAITMALVVLVGGGAIAVRSVVSERDRADVQRRLALDGQRHAEAAEQRATERADQLLLTQAQMLVATNPTAAIAMLKQIASKPERWAQQWRQARGIAAEARAAGVAFAIRAPEDPSTIELSRDGIHAIVLGRDGVLWLADLEARTSRQLAEVPERTVAYAGSERVLAYATRALTMISTTDGTRVELPFEHTLRDMQATADRMYFNDLEGRVWIYDLATRTTTRLGGATGIERLALAPNGERLLLIAETRVIEVDLTRSPPRFTDVAPGGATVAAWNASSTAYGVLYADRFGWFEAGRPPVWAQTSAMPLALGALEHAPVVIGGFEGVATLSRGKLVMQTVAAGTPVFAPRPVTGNRVALSRGKDVVILDGSHGVTLRSPAERGPRFGNGPPSKYIVLGVPGYLLVWNIEDVLPTPQVVASDVSSALMLGPHDVFVSDTASPSYRWIDLAAHTERRFEHIPPLSTIETNATADRLFLVAHGARGGWLIEKTRDRPEYFDLDLDLAGFDPADRLWIATTDGVLTGYDRDLQPIVVDRGASRLRSLGWSREWIAFLREDGTLARRHVASKHVDTLVLSPEQTRETRALRVAPDGQVFIAVGGTLLRWERDRALVEHARLPEPIIGLIDGKTMVLALTATGSGYRIPLDPDAHVMSALPLGTRHLHVSVAAALAVYVIAGGLAEVADLETGRHWPLVNRDADDHLEFPTLGVDGSTVLGLRAGQALMYRLALPGDADATRRWLDTMTNATAELGPTTVTWH